MTDLAVVCDKPTAITRSLLGYGALAGPLYVGVSLAQALTRPGFDLSRHSWSLLENGPLGFIQIANFVVTGLAVIAFSVGLGRAGATRGRRGVMLFGIALVLAGVFTADPAQGFPVGTPPSGNAISWHGLLHLLAGGIAFVSLAIAALRSTGTRAWRTVSRVAGVLVLAGFACVAAGGGTVWSVQAFVFGVLAGFAWLAAHAVRSYRALEG